MVETMGKRTFEMQRIGDLKLVKKLAAKMKPVTAADQKFVDAVFQIRQEPDATEKAFMARQLVQCTLPHANPGHLPVWTRRNGYLAFSPV